MTGPERLQPALTRHFDDTGPADLTSLRDELRQLIERHHQLDHAIRDAVTRQKFCSCPHSVIEAKADEGRHLASLNRVMTRMRAVEAKLLLARRRLH